METSNSQLSSKSAVSTTLEGDVAPSSADSGDSYSFPPLSASNNVAYQRRRVNPESLALRLGPELVRDLDALITPGNTDMPSFAVRKELQERYNIDRRHIYDYFHSRGLRVVKEDKHDNPMAMNDLPTSMPNLRPLRQAPAKNARSHPLPYPLAEKKFSRSRGVTKAKPGRPKKNPPVNPEILTVTCVGTNESITGTNNPVSEHSPVAAPNPTYVSVNPLLPCIPPIPVLEGDENGTFNSFANPLDESFSVKRAIGDVAYAYRHKPVFERMQELIECPAKPVLTGDLSSSWNETYGPCFASDKELLLPHAKPLTQAERYAFYETLSDSLGPAHGIQECQGTYRKHMEARAKLYFKDLISVPSYHYEQPVGTGTLLDRNPLSGTNEFRHWLSESRFLKRDGTSGLSRFHPSHRNTDVEKRHETGGASNQPFRQRFNRHWIQTLDDLFPMPEDDLNNNDPIAGSPVVHTREIAGMAEHVQGIADVCRAGDRLLFSVMSGPSSLGPPVTLALETRQAGRAQFHGLANFPVLQGVRSGKLAAEMDSRPQWLEQVPHVAHSGRSALLGETQYRNRNLSSSARSCLASTSPRKSQIRDLDRIWTRPATPRDARRRTPSAAGDI